MKTLIISSDYSRGKAFNGAIEIIEWEDFSVNRVINFSDYDNLIIDLLSLSQLRRSDELEESLKWFTANYTAKQTYEILSGDNSSIVVLGDLSTKLLNKTILCQLGIRAEVEQKQGTSFAKRDYDSWRFHEYIDGIKKYKYIFKDIRAIGSDEYGIDGTQIEQKILARNKEDYIAASLSLGNWRNFDMVIPMVEGVIELIPPLRDSQDSIDAILGIVAGEVETEDEPEWATAIFVNGQGELENNIALNKEKIVNLEEKNNAIAREIKEKRSIVEILYKSDKPLEESVALTFEKLGCDIERPAEKNKEEFCVALGDIKFVVEVKSSIKSTVDLKGFRQLSDWQDEVFDRTGEFYKQLLIVNTEYNKPPDKRKPFILADNQTIYSEKKEICVLTTTRLFNFVNDSQSNGNAVKEFMDSLSRQNGLFC